MSLRTKDKLIKYGVSFAIGIIMFVIYMNEYYSKDLSDLDKYHVLCDAFFIPGMLLVCFGLLLFVSSLGVFDGTGYGLRMAIRSLTGANRRNPEKYADYLERKRNSRVKGFWPIIYVGLIFLAIALLFLIKFNAEL